MRDLYNKLVRDRIPEIIRQRGSAPEVRVIEGQELLVALKSKLREEAEELCVADDDHVIEELADVHEVLLALQQQLGISDDELAQVRNAKKEERGGFEKGIVLVSVEE